MACSSCAAKQAIYNNRNAVTRTVSAPVEKLGECVFTKEQIQEKLDEMLLKLEKESLTSKRIKIRTSTIRLRNAINEYDTNCNKYLRFLYELL